MTVLNGTTRDYSMNNLVLLTQSVTEWIYNSTFIVKMLATIQ